MRSGTASSNMFDDRPREIQYFHTDKESSGAQLEGQDSYTITFSKGSFRRLSRRQILAEKHTIRAI